MQVKHDTGDRGRTGSAGMTHDNEMSRQRRSQKGVRFRGANEEVELLLKYDVVYNNTPPKDSCAVIRKSKGTKKNDDLPGAPSSSQRRTEYVRKGKRFQSWMDDRAKFRFRFRF